MSVFAKAKPVEVPVKESKKKDEKRQVAMDDVANFAAVSALVKNLKTVLSTLETKIKASAKSEFIRLGTADLRRPDSFAAVEKDARVTVILGKRSTASALTPEEVVAFEKEKVPFGKEVTLPERYIVNPAYAGDQALLEKVSKAIESIKGIPEDFIQLQPEVKDFVVTDETVDNVFERGLAATFMGMVTTISLKPSTAQTDVKKALEQVKALLVPSKKEG
jgi:hypothetical protein